MVNLSSSADYLEVIEDLKQQLENDREYIDELESEVSKLKQQILLITLSYKKCNHC